MGWLWYWQSGPVPLTFDTWVVLQPISKANDLKLKTLRSFLPSLDTESSICGSPCLVSPELSKWHTDCRNPSLQEPPEPSLSKADFGRGWLRWKPHLSAFSLAINVCISRWDTVWPKKVKGISRVKESNQRLLAPGLQFLLELMLTFFSLLT